MVDLDLVQNNLVTARPIKSQIALCNCSPAKKIKNIEQFVITCRFRERAIYPKIPSNKSCNY